MEHFILSILFLVLTTGCKCLADNRFFISAPGVFHVGVKEKVFVQMGNSYFNQPVNIFLEHPTVRNTRLTEKIPVPHKENEHIQTVELMINRDKYFQLTPKRERHYVHLVAESPSFGRKITKVFISQHRGYIFIQTDQPIYNPTKTVKYRIFTLDHTLRPHEETFHLSVINAAGNRVIKYLLKAKGGIYQGNFQIPDVSKLGTWKITAHYEHDEANKASREFEVKKFVLPSFEVNIAMKQSYILLNDEHISFTISARYSHGEKVRGAYHCQFGFLEKDPVSGQNGKPVYIGGLEITGSVQNGDEPTVASLRIVDLQLQLQKQNLTLSKLQQRGAQLYLGVFVTNILSGEIQGDEVHLPIVPHKYTMDLSQIRSNFLPGYPLDVRVLMRHPDGSPAANVLVKVNVSSSTEEYQADTTDKEGTVMMIFNIAVVDQITLHVSADDLKQSKVIQRATSPSNSFLYLSVSHKVYSVGQSVPIEYTTVNGPGSGYIYYMVLSRGILVDQGKLRFGISLKQTLPVTHQMVPFFRLVAYFYDQNGNIIADSAWVDVHDDCEIQVEVKTEGQAKPTTQTKVHFKLNNRNAKVAMLAVDKAIYALKANNKLTAKQVFSAMQSYDLGCSYGGGSTPASVLTDAGLSYFTHSESEWKKGLSCNTRSTRQTRDIDLEQEMMTLKSNFSDEKLKECCVHGFSLIPMKRTCVERARRVSLVEENTLCSEAFLRCCLEGERLRQKKAQEDARKGLGRTVSSEEIEQFFLENASRNIRRLFPPSFEFREFDVNGEKSHEIILPDSITTWEIQVVTVSADTGFCVVKPTEIKASQDIFVSLRLPYSVKKYEQLSISPVIYNYGQDTIHFAVKMEQTEGLCSPGSATATTFVNFTLGPESSQLVSFSAVPMVDGPIPIKIQLYDIGDVDKGGWRDAIEKTLNVLSEGMEKSVEETKVFKLDGKSASTFIIDGSLPEDRVPGSGSNIFVSAEGSGFGSSYARNLLSPAKVKNLLRMPTGCSEQTSSALTFTVLALRYLDLSDQWFDLPADARDQALQYVQHGPARVMDHKQDDGSYVPYKKVKPSTWLTAFIVKVLSLVAQRQSDFLGEQSSVAKIIPEEEIRHPVRYLMSAQSTDGSFPDLNPVIHIGILGGDDQVAAITAFVTIALNRSLEFLTPEERSQAVASISRATTYLQQHFQDLTHPYAVAITAHCLAFCLPSGTDHSSAWSKLQTFAVEGKNGCLLWTTNHSPENKKYADAITIETTAYALLVAVGLGKTEWAEKAACWLNTQENYWGGFRSTQDTAMALEALGEYELKRSGSPEASLRAEFTTEGRSNVIHLNLENKKDKVEQDLKKFAGENIKVEVTGTGETKLKVMKVYHLLEPKDTCEQVSIRVTVQGAVKYTAEVLENYEDYEDYYDTEDKEVRVTRSAIEWFDAHSRHRRALDNDLNSDKELKYEVCVSHSRHNNLTGMAIADITLLSGFEVETDDLDILKDGSEGYISHYEVSFGRVIIYFSRLFDEEECIDFRATQTVPISLLQPAPAVFYDYYEPNRKCTVFYSAPQRSKLVSKLCSEDVCQCAERPCHIIQSTFKSERGQRGKVDKRLQHACFFPTVDYAYMVEVLNISMKGNFELYGTNVIEVLKSHGDVMVDENSTRVFAKRRHCTGQLEVGKQYLIMGKDGSTTDSNKKMQYLLESNTWVEKRPSDEECKKSANARACEKFNSFTQGYKGDGCRQ
ncbi:complement C4-B [Halichoeres trimaculatus]|uniref:complement C4-B n=1 Tax=Halichoeres trimaculatus TaxID=147232 RepID=UPI003D9F4492